MELSDLEKAFLDAVKHQSEAEVGERPNQGWVVAELSSRDDRPNGQIIKDIADGLADKGLIEIDESQNPQNPNYKLAE